MGQKMWGYRYVLAVAGALAIGSALRAEDDAAKTESKAHSRVDAERRIEATLGMPLKAPLEFIETPLNQITEVLAEDYDIQILFDTSALDALACSPEVETSIRVGNVSLRSALELMLREAGDGELTYIIENEVLLITTQEEEDKRLEVRVYRVGDIVGNDPHGLLSDDASLDSLMDVITSAVETDSWMENGTGEGDIQAFGGDMLVIAQTRRVHDGVAQLLQLIREAKQATNAASAEDLASADSRPITRSIQFFDKAISEDKEARNTIRNVIRQSVDWERQVEGLKEEDRFLYVLPNRILVRHVPEVVLQVARVADKVCASNVSGPTGIGCTLGHPGGSGANGAETSGGAGVAPAN